MKRNFDLELRLQPLSKRDDDVHSKYLSSQDQQPLTIFYNGQVCACTVSEQQARAILLLASREMELSRARTPKASESTETSPTAAANLQTTCNPTGLSMKRSLQRFLQKRRHRIQSTSPYHF